MYLCLCVYCLLPQNLENQLIFIYEYDTNCGYSDTPLTVTLLPFPEGVTVSGHICIWSDIFDRLVHIWSIILKNLYLLYGLIGYMVSLPWTKPRTADHISDTHCSNFNSRRRDLVSVGLGSNRPQEKAASSHLAYRRRIAKSWLLSTSCKKNMTTN